MANILDGILEDDNYFAFGSPDAPGAEQVTYVDDNGTEYTLYLAVRRLTPEVMAEATGTHVNAIETFVPKSSDPKRGIPSCKRGDTLILSRRLGDDPATFRVTVRTETDLGGWQIRAEESSN